MMELAGAVMKEKKLGVLMDTLGGWPPWEIRLSWTDADGSIMMMMMSL